MKINKGGQILPISAHEMAPICAFSVLQKWPKIAKNDHDWPFDPRNGLHWTAEENWTKHSFSFLKFITLVDLERKNEFHGNIATHRLWDI